MEKAAGKWFKRLRRVMGAYGSFTTASKALVQLCLGGDSSPMRVCGGPRG